MIGTSATCLHLQISMHLQHSNSQSSCRDLHQDSGVEPSLSSLSSQQSRYENYTDDQNAVVKGATSVAAMVVVNVVPIGSCI